MSLNSIESIIDKIKKNNINLLKTNKQKYLFDKGLNNLKETFHQAQLKNNNAKVLEFKNISINYFKNSCGFCLIDNRFKIIFTDVYSKHIQLRKDLLILTLILKDKIKKIPNEYEFDDYFANIYIANHLGAFISGNVQELKIDDKRSIIVGQRYPFQELKQDFLTEFFHIDFMLYTKEESNKDLSMLLNFFN